jgi:hypothetical protein
VQSVRGSEKVIKSEFFRRKAIRKPSGDLIKAISEGDSHLRSQFSERRALHVSPGLGASSEVGKYEGMQKASAESEVVTATQNLVHAHRDSNQIVQ